eukprot:4654220-Ditylum_brightwellii.AAC.1
MPFHISADIYHNADTSAYQGPHNWQSQQPSVPLLPQYAYSIATLPVVQGELGIYSPRNCAIASFISPLIRSIHAATTGIAMRDFTTKLSHMANNKNGHDVLDNN